MSKSEFVEIRHGKCKLYFPYDQFLEALRRGKAFNRSKERRPRERQMHAAAERRRDAMLGMPQSIAGIERLGAELERQGLLEEVEEAAE